MRNSVFLVLCAAFLLPACGDDTGGGGTPDGLGFGPGEARAGVLTGDQLPFDDSGLAVYSAGDLFLANENFGIVIEDAITDQTLDSDLYVPFGGGIVGMAGISFAGSDGAAFIDRTDFNEFVIGLSRFMVRPDSVTVANDGADGQAAIVSVSGKLSALPFLEDVLATGSGLTTAGGLILNSRDSDDATFLAAGVTVEYELQPDANFVDVFYTLDSAVDATPIYLFIQSRRLPPYVPGNGFGTASASGKWPYMAFVDETTVSYAIEDPARPMSSLIAAFDASGEISGVQPLVRSEQTEFASGAREHVARLHIGGRGLDGLRRAIAETNNETTRVISGVVTDANASPMEGVRVHATLAGDGSYLTRALTDGSGAYELTVPTAAVEVTAYKRGEGIPTPVAVAADASTGDIKLPGAGAISIVATEMGTDAALPVRVQIIDENNAYAPPSNFGEAITPGGPMGDRVHVVFPTNGVQSLQVPTGEYRVVVSRGYEYSIYNELHDVAAGATVDVPVALERVVDSTGVMCADFHIHTTRSPDSPDSGEFKVAAAVGDGVELPVRTDHEFVGTFEPEVASLGVQNWALGLSSLELTTFTWGHFGVFPFEADPTMVNGGATRWYGVDTTTGEVVIDKPVEVFERARGNDERDIIIFHPRTPPGQGGLFSSASGGQYFEGDNVLSNIGGVGLDPITGLVTGNGKFDPEKASELAEWWDTDFSTMETFNDRSFEGNKLNAGRMGDAASEYGTVDDWFNFLQQGRRVFSVGSSDSHSVMGGSPVGYPRTCIAVGSDDPAALRALSGTPEALRQNIKNGETVINGGFYLTADADGVGPGGTIMTPMSMETVTLEVQAPMWVGDVHLIEMWWGDGATISSEEIANQSVSKVMDAMFDQEAIMRFSGDVSIPETAKWVVFHARGKFNPAIASRSDQAQTLAPVHPGRLPFGVTNPIFYTRP